MPFKYAIAETSDRQTPRKEWIDWYTPEYEKAYLTAPKDYAEPHKDGYKMLVTVEGKPLSGWVPLKRQTHDLTELKRKSKAPALTDYLGIQLQVGDYVLTHIKRYVDLQVCEVIGFVKQGKARILPLDDIEQYHGILRFPSEIVQIPRVLLGDDPASEWIPTEEEMI